MTKDLRKILIVEDSELMHRMYHLIFSRRPAGRPQLLKALNGREGLALIAVNPDCDLILLDINLPIMGGFEFLKELRSDSAYKAIPVIIVSRDGTTEDALQALKAGAQTFITKPFQPYDLLHIVDHMVAGGKTTDVQ